MDKNFEFLKVLEIQKKQIENLVRPSIELAKYVATVTAPAKRLIEAQSVYLNAYAKIVQPLAEALEMQKPEFREFEREFGWMGFLPAKTMWGFYRIFKEEDKNVENTWRDIISFLASDKSKNELESIFNSSPLFQDRMKVISRGLEHHISGDYIDSVSILLPQVEGLIWDIGVKKGVVGPQPNSRYKMDSNGNYILDNNGRPKSWGIGELVSHIWNEPRFEKYFREKVYSTEFRHPLLHGRSLDFFTEEKSACVILLLVAIYSQVK